MIRKIIEIDETKCNGCGACAKACHEGAIGMVNGIAKLLRDDYCDGLGDCLPTCPTSAITFVEREAAAYDEAAVKENMAKKASMVQDTEEPEKNVCCTTQMPSQLKNWPVQMKLAPLAAPFFNGCKLLIAADCTAFSYANFHQDFLRGRVCLMGCPKLDSVDYSEKLAEILRQNHIEDITVLRMQVPCCGGLEFAVKKALHASGKSLPLHVITFSIHGEIL